MGEVMIEQLSKYKDLFYYIPAAVPSAVAALEMAAEIRGNYEYGGAYLAPVVGIFLSVLFVMVGKSVGVGFANALTNNDKLLTGLFLLGLVGYGAGEWWVNPLAAGKVASVFVVAFYIAVPLARIVEGRAAEAATIRASAARVQVAEQKVAEAKLQLELKELQQAKRDVGKVSETVSGNVSDVSETLETSETGGNMASLTQAELDVLRAVLDGASVQADIVRLTGRSRGTVSKAINARLEPMGAVLINGHGIEATDKGRSLLN